MPARWAVVLAALAAALAPTAALRAHPGLADPRAPLSGDELRHLGELARSATVGITAVACDGATRGSGFEVGGWVVTNRHVVEGAWLVHVAPSAAAADLVGLHPAVDLAVVAATGLDGPALELAPAPPGDGEPVVLAGRPADGGVAVVAARVQLHGPGGVWGMAGEVLVLEGPTGPGWSGGPVLDRRGRVVGVLAAQDRVTGLALAVPAGELRRWLDHPAAGPPGGGGC